MKSEIGLLSVKEAETVVSKYENILRIFFSYRAHFFYVFVCRDYDSFNFFCAYQDRPRRRIFLGLESESSHVHYQIKFEYEILIFFFTCFFFFFIEDASLPRSLR